jgi:hypothetical protein
MKKIIVLLAAITILANTITAQENKTDFRDRFLVGLKAGLNYSNVYDSQGEEFRANPKAGLAAGAFLTIPIGKYIGIQPEVLISQKGFKATGRLLGSNYSLTRTSNYLDIPLFFLLKPSKFITLLAGPQFSYLIKQTDAFTNGTTTIEQETVFANENVRKNTLCFVGGLDITIKHIVLSGRAGWDVQDNNGNGTSTTPRYKNVWYQATIGYRFYNN